MNIDNWLAIIGMIVLSGGAIFGLWALIEDLIPKKQKEKSV